jgi:hypothetical protein
MGLGDLNGVDGWTAAGNFYPPGVSASADACYAKLQHGTMGVSISFIPKVVDATKLFPGQRSVTFWEVEVFDVSIVNIPSCPTSVVMEKQWRGAAERSDMLIRRRGTRTWRGSTCMPTSPCRLRIARAWSSCAAICSGRRWRRTGSGSSPTAASCSC